jgi:hypothetical protein
METRSVGERKHYLDWLRVVAFAVLILFHVGMLYVNWPYNLKSPRLYSALEPLMNVASPWRLVLLFLISGVASRFLIGKLGPGAFALDRLRRLLPVILVGMFVVIPPQTYVMLLGRGLLHTDFLTFWWTQYLAADQTLVRPLGRTMPTWDHLWFLVYLLVYALLAAAGLWTLGRSGRRSFTLPPWVLVIAPAAWLAAANLVIHTWAPITHALVNDPGGHLKWGGVFVFGLIAAGQDRFWTLLEAHRGKALVAALLLLAVQLGVDDPAWSLVSGLYAWAAVCALCGFAKAHLQRPSPLLSHLNEAILPVYVLHQPVMLVAAFWVFQWRMPVAAEAALLVAATFAGSFALYEAVIRPFAIMRFLFGLKGRAAG